MQDAMCADEPLVLRQVFLVNANEVYTEVSRHRLLLLMFNVRGHQFPFFGLGQSHRVVLSGWESKIENRISRS